MVGRRAVRSQGGVMSLGRIADVLVPAVGWEFFVQLAHEAVARDLGYDGSRRDGVAMGIALHDRLIRPRRFREAVVAVDQQEVRAGHEGGGGVLGHDQGAVEVVTGAEILAANALPGVPGSVFVDAAGGAEVGRWWAGAGVERGEAKLRARLLSTHDIEVGAGLGVLAGRIWRIGLMGENARTTHVDRLLEALRAEL